MKTWNIRFYLKTGSASLVTTVTAKTYGDAKRIIEGQYGDSLRSISQIQEVK